MIFQSIELTDDVCIVVQDDSMKCFQCICIHVLVTLESTLRYFAEF